MARLTKANYETEEADDDTEDETEEEVPVKMEKKNHKSTKSAVKDALVTGTKMGLAQEAAELIVQAAKKVAGDQYPAWLETDFGKRLAPFVLASGLHYFCENFPDAIPRSEEVMAACELAMTKEAADHVHEVVAAFRPALAGLADLGKLVIKDSNGETKSE